MHDAIGIPAFARQAGYAAFSVSRSGIDAVSRYIDTQRDHRTRRTFKEKLIGFLHRHGLEFDERFIVD